MSSMSNQAIFGLKEMVEIQKPRRAKGHPREYLTLFVRMMRRKFHFQRPERTIRNIQNLEMREY